jgi:hypothetical protein
MQMASDKPIMPVINSGRMTRMMKKKKKKRWKEQEQPLLPLTCWSHPVLHRSN